MPNITYQILHFIYLLGLIIWVGGLFYAVFVLAPATFGVIKDRRLAGDLVGRNLDIMRKIHNIVIPATFISSAMIYELYKTPTPLNNAHSVLLLLMTLIYLYGIFIVVPNIKKIRAQLHDTGVDAGEKEILQQKFNDFHKTSMNVTMGQLVTGIVVVFLS